MISPADGGSSRRYNATMRKFGAPGTVVREYDEWAVLLRPAQVTLGALVIAAYQPASALPQLSERALTELGRVAGDLEEALRDAFGMEKVNYLMLMMVDPDVHFHVLPRYGGAREHRGQRFEDPGWPGPPALDRVNETDDALNRSIIERLRSGWPDAGARHGND